MLGCCSIAGLMQELGCLAEWPDDAPGARRGHFEDFKAEIAAEAMSSMHDKYDDAMAAEISLMQGDAAGVGVAVAV